MSKSKKQLAIDTLMESLPPFYYDAEGQTILDQNGRMIVDVRGWGWIRKLDQAEDRQDAIGELITNYLNEVIK